MTDPNASIDNNSLLDDVLDRFEVAWIPDDHYLKFAVDNGGRRLDSRGIAELVRSDIDRRYSAGCNVDLLQYFNWFPELMLNASLAHSIGFEDYRSRKTRGLLIHHERWGWIPNIQSASWFRELHEVAGQDHLASPNSLRSKRHQMSPSWGDVEPKVGEKFGEFQLIATLGVGSFSQVFLATQPSLASRYVALKIVKKTLDEPEHLARLQHTGIVPIYSLHRMGAYSILCMPYFGAATLADWLSDHGSDSQRNGQSLIGTVQQAQTRIGSSSSLESTSAVDSFPNEQDRIRVWNAAGAQPLSRLVYMDEKGCLIWLSRRMASALAHAHERDVIHGDLKPANVLLKNDGEPALIDFNLARKLEEKPSTHVGGTLPYMAPEQLLMLLGRRQYLSSASDVYSLGIMLYQIAENRLPFPAPLSSAESDIAIAHQHRKQTVRFTSNKISSGMRSILAKCLEFEPTDRYSSGSTLLEDLDCEASNLPLKYAKESILKSRIPKLVHRYPRLFSVVPVIAIATFIVCSFAFASWYWWVQVNRWSSRDEFTDWTNQVSLRTPEMLEGSDEEIQSTFDTMNQIINSMIGGRTQRGLLAKLNWLPMSERIVAERDFYDDLLLFAGLSNERRGQLTSVQVAQLESWLELCKKPYLFGDASVGSVTGSLVSDSERILQSRALVNRGVPGRSLELLTEITPKSSNKYLYWITVGDAERKMGHAQAAVHAYGLAINQLPQSSVGYARRAQLLIELKKWSDAERDCDSLIGLNPGNAFRYAERARVRHEVGRTQDAMLDMDEAIDLEPKANRFYFFRSRLRREANDLAKAKDDFLLGLGMTPRTTEDWISRALAQLPRNPEKAMSDLERAERLEPNRFEVLQNKAHVLSDYLNDDNAASQVLKTILDHDPENDWARVDRCVLLARAGKKDEVLKEVKNILGSGKPIGPATYYQVACAHSLLASQHSDCRVNALHFLSKAILGGYGHDLLETDKDLDSVRSDVEFHSLLQSVHLSRQPALSNP